MSLFDGPEHESYIALMRELRLERGLEEGDFFIASFGSSVEPYHSDWARGHWPMESRSVAALGLVWLPRLDQWYALIRETWATGGGPGIHLYGDDEVGYGCEADMKSVMEHGEGKTPEEACARLFMAVTGRPS